MPKPKRNNPLIRKVSKREKLSRHRKTRFDESLNSVNKKPKKLGTRMVRERIAFLKEMTEVVIVRARDKAN